MLLLPTLKSIVAGALLAAASATPTEPTTIEVGAGEHLVVVAPHPDDETLGAGGLIRRVIERGGTVRVIFVTAGDGYVEAVAQETGRPRPRPAEYVAYGERRLREARLALRELGGDAIRAQHLLGFPDGGIEPLLTTYWRAHPEQSSTTGASAPPYPEAEHPGVVYDGEDLRRALVQCFSDERPTMIAFPDPLDRHPDHRASGTFTLLAVKDLMRQGTRAAKPQLLAYLVHWPDWPPGWDASSPSTKADRGPLALPPSLPRRGLNRVSLVLGDDEVTAKRRALAQYASQQQVMASFLAAFVRRTEPFSIFTEPQ